MKKYILALPLLAGLMSCVGMGSRLEGAWQRSDSLAEGRFTETLDFTGSDSVAQTFTVYRGDHALGNVTMHGEWHMEKRNVVLDYDTTRITWSGDTLMGDEVKRLMSRGVNRAAFDSPIGLGNPRFFGDSVMEATVSGRKVVYRRVKK